MPDLITTCPACGHHTIQAVGGMCTVFVPGPVDGPLAEKCGCDCYKALTGRTMFEDIAATLWGPKGEDADA